MKSVSKLIFSRGTANLINNKTLSKIMKPNSNIFSFSKNNLINFQYKNFSGCGSSNCSSNKTEEDEIEKNLKSLNQRVIQCINLGQFDDAMDLSEEYITQVKSHFGKKK